MNAFSVLVFSRSSAPEQSRPPAFLTSKPLSSPARGHKFLATSSTLTVDEALALCQSENQIVDPRVPSVYGPIESPGMWVGPFFVADDDAATRACVPSLHRSFWLKERWQPRSALQNELGPQGTGWLHERVLETLGVSLAHRSERIGNFLIVLPEERVRMRTRFSSSHARIGVEVRAEPGGPEDLLVVAKGSRHGHVLTATAQRIAPGLHVLPMPSTIDHREIELYDARTGLLLERDAGVPLRELALDLNLMTTEVDLQFNFERADGTSEPPIQVRTQWGYGQPSLIGARAEWERVVDDIKRDEERLRLQSERRFLVYRGSPADRERAIKDIRQLMRSTKEFVKVWDPYFGHREAASFLPFVLEPTIPIQVLTSLWPTPDEERNTSTAQQTSGGSDGTRDDDDVGRSSEQRSPAAWKKRLLTQVAATLREPQKGVSGLSALEVRSGGSSFHDRFLITRDRCWQLGCSFNQMGAVMSTIVEFPYPAVIEREFDEAWKQAMSLVT